MSPKADHPQLPAKPEGVGSAVEAKANILVIDDDPAKRMALAAVLESLGHELFLAGSSSEVLQLLPKREYALVLLDVQMPDVDGFEIAKLIRSRRQSAHTPIIFVTAHYGADVDVRRGYSLGAVDYIFAPVIPEILRAKASVFVELALMRQKLEVANKDLESFTYSVSHDLRAPLRAIDGYARMLEEDHAGKLDDEGRRLLKTVLDSSSKMRQLIDDLLAFSRFNRKAVRSTDLDMSELARDVYAELTALHSGRAPELRLSALPPAKGDPSLLRQVWANLLSNSIKYTGKHAQPVIEVSGRTDGREHVYCVKDNGAGFDMRYYDKLFGIFQRLHNDEEFRGTGVGLAIVERVVSRHGGRVWAEGKVNEGASFFFSLPSGSAS
jgi:signal transduction histidine kinase